ncbi:KpsF/GutQ family sugar-phosphate isomerase [Psychroflexus halocasei]|uniref:Arabinose-5-phosphate isomerase n=1 Tax=Psychroflexus halocasei TaxID=908615 RepID=A0A1H4C7S1_9FLAO|nr:KpsF/GutQ family sugar-phosphate isomerase [Psychroflexus halocasei]SEA56132.1 arabinose-5-phosphate isomerase [Psychroflexus halocasei]
MSQSKIQTLAKETIQLQAIAISSLVESINIDFEKAVDVIFNSSGRVVITGVGKSAIIAQKIVATLNSTGTPSIYMHAADAIHGDLGNIQKDDVVICISKSGTTPEIKVLVPFIQSFGNTLIAITGNLKSFLAEEANYVLDTHVEKEACPNNLAPTTSTTAQLVMGDALAIALLNLRGFSSSDFARYHPGGALGKALYLRVSDVTKHNQKPQVSIDASLRDIIIEISEKMLGVAAVIENDKIVGIITDGDLRRMLKNNTDVSQLKAKDIMSKNPKTISNDAMAIDAMEILETNDISQVISEENGKYAGVVHIHNLVKEGII